MKDQTSKTRAHCVNTVEFCWLQDWLPAVGSDFSESGFREPKRWEFTENYSVSWSDETMTKECIEFSSYPKVNYTPMSLCWWLLTYLRQFISAHFRSPRCRCRRPRPKLPTRILTRLKTSVWVFISPTLFLDTSYVLRVRFCFDAISYQFSGQPFSDSTFQPVPKMEGAGLQKVNENLKSCISLLLSLTI